MWGWQRRRPLQGPFEIGTHPLLHLFSETLHPLDPSLSWILKTKSLQAIACCRVNWLHEVGITFWLSLKTLTELYFSSNRMCQDSSWTRRSWNGWLGKSSGNWRMMEIGLLEVPAINIIILMSVLMSLCQPFFHIWRLHLHLCSKQNQGTRQISERKQSTAMYLCTKVRCLLWYWTCYI